MSHKRIALDLDGVCYNYSATACLLLNHYKGYSLDWTQTNSWGWLQSQVKNNDWQWLWSGGVKEGLFRYGSLLKGAAEGIKKLSALGQLVVVTSRPTSAINDTLDWLAFMRFPVSEVHILSHGQSKADIKPDIAIDDGPANIEDYIKADIPVVIYRHKYNNMFNPVPNKVLIAENWKDVILATESVIGKSS